MLSVSTGVNVAVILHVSTADIGSLQFFTWHTVKPLYKPGPKDRGAIRAAQAKPCGLGVAKVELLPEREIRPGGNVTRGPAAGTRDKPGQAC